MFGMNGDRGKRDSEFNIFDVKSVEEFIERMKVILNSSLEGELKEQLRKLRIEYKRDEQNAINTGITAKIEERSKEWICPRIPKWVDSDMLTALGVVGSIMIAAGFILGFFNKYYLILVILGFIINWFGDSFDGSLARYRKKTRPNYGYYIDHIIDGIAVFILGLGMGLSGFFRIEIALTFIIVYILLILHVELVTYVQNEFKYSFGLFGPTEVRIIGMIATVVLFFVPVKYFNVYGHYLTQYDFALLFVSLVMFGILFTSVLSKGIELDKIDRKRWKKEE
jgi:phosphatidylglycerophosphate synthase